MDINAAYPSKFLKAADLRNKAYTVTVADVRMEDVGQENAPEHKPVLYLHGSNKGVVLNKTNASMLEYLFGPETDRWRGQKVEIFADMVPFQGKVVPAIRFRGAPGMSAPAGLATPPTAPGATPPPPPASPAPAPLGAPAPATGPFDERNPPPELAQPGDLEDEIPW